MLSSYEENTLFPLFTYDSFPGTLKKRENFPGKVPFRKIEFDDGERRWMGMPKNLSIMIASVLLGFFSFWGVRTMAEEILTTNNAIHLGWVTSKNTFTTCHKEILEIGEGSVEKTKQTCPGFERTQLVKGLVDSIDGSNQILWVRDGEGQIQELFFFENIESYEKTQLRDLEKGDKITVTVPIPGRVGLVQVESRQKQ